MMNKEYSLEDVERVLHEALKIEERLRRIEQSKGLNRNGMRSKQPKERGREQPHLGSSLMSAILAVLFISAGALACASVPVAPCEGEVVAATLLRDLEAVRGAR